MIINIMTLHQGPQYRDGGAYFQLGGGGGGGGGGEGLENERQRHEFVGGLGASSPQNFEI